MSHLQVGALALDAATILTIASGAVTPTQGFHLCAAESSTTDDLDSIAQISGISVPYFLMLQADSGDTITVKNSSSIKLIDSQDVILSGDRTLLLFWDGTNYAEVSSPTRATYSTANVSSPPTDAELDAILTPGASTKLQPVFINDNGGSTTYWLAMNDGTAWAYVQMTKAT